jgi:phosphatidylglycerol:prolipoprotein diacylglycerol transferase
MFLHTWHPHALITTIGGFQLHWYGLFLAAGAVLGILLVEYLGRKYALDTNKLFDLTLVVLVSAFIGARLYHVANEWPYYSTHTGEILRVWNGGLALHGGLLFGGIALLVMAKRQQWNAWLIADILAPAVALGQAFGRWGNYFNQELFGKPTTLPWGIPIDPLNRPPDFFTSPYFHPTFLYESLGVFLIAVGLYLLHRRQWRQPIVQRRVGNIALYYLAAYSILRLSLEFLRLDRTPIVGGVRLPILVSGLVIFIVIATYLYRNLRRHVA